MCKSPDDQRLMPVLSRGLIFQIEQIYKKLNWFGADPRSSFAMNPARQRHRAADGGPRFFIRTQRLTSSCLRQPTVFVLPTPAATDRQPGCRAPHCHSGSLE